MNDNVEFEPVFKFALDDELVKVCTKFNHSIFLPNQSESTATGWDVRCADQNGVNLVPGRYLKIPLGFRVFSPSGWWLKLVPRSSTFLKKHFHALYGTIDETYEGQVYFCGQYLEDACILQNRNCPSRIEFGDRIGQLIPVKRQIMTVEVVSNDVFDLLSSTRGASRKSGGFGSSGNR